MGDTHVQMESGVFGGYRRLSEGSPQRMRNEGQVPLTGGNPHPGRRLHSCTHLLKFLDLGLFKHGEHVGIGALCSLLGFLGCLGGSID